MAFDDACELLTGVLSGDVRRAIVSEAADAPALGEALTRLGGMMRAHRFAAGGRDLRLDEFVDPFVERTAAEGFHPLHDRDRRADRVNDEIVPVEVLRYVSDARGSDAANPAVPALLLDYYFVYILTLLTLRIWDAGAANANLSRVTSLLHLLQGPHGSGQRFAADAATLFLVATSHREPDERGFAPLFDRVRALGLPHQTAIGLTHAAGLGSQLRFDFEATYRRDSAVQRAERRVDYSRLSFALFASMREYSRLHEEGVPGGERQRVVEAMLNGLTADAAYFIRRPETHATPEDAERLEFAELFRAYRTTLLDEFARLQPSERQYSPLSFFFNVPHNIVKGAVIDAALWGEPSTVSLSDLFTSVSASDAERASKAALAKTLMGYARANPRRIGGRLMPVVVYDPQAGRRTFSAAMRTLKTTS
jgi:hypothetical protein